MHQSTLEIRKKIIDALRSDIVDLNNHIQRQFNISRQAVNKHLRALEEEGFLTSFGKTKNKNYQLGEIRQQSKIIKLDKKIDEFDVYSQDFEWVVENAPKNIQEIVDWGFTEILNNAIDHAQAKTVFIVLSIKEKELFLTICDDGEGIFNRIKRIKDFDSDQRVVLELSKGKLTTDDENHTGLDIFFSIEAFDFFAIYSNNHLYNFNNNTEINLEKYGFEKVFKMGDDLGFSTAVRMSIKLSSTTKLKDVFDKFAKAPEFEFDTTIVSLYLVNEKQNLVSRSQAKQATNRLEEFKFVTFDFKGIGSIGQGFADELFRVYPNKNPQISFDYVNADVEVEKMIKRVKK
ncbi:ATP-binding region, ATPase-like [uncultured Gammaproteobacteria bacterium]|jgi:DNA-binding Lrp family transcriptional regulator|nr:ATP-binding region, ATPase-like [uncultured Gammaproteobacteria bacterium]CAC9573068.1 ATP-binding region, ATPase-like [uncultured Gammaproteobacteria bacterium]CAC9980531.1 ATP-binding region, ATPase-like [uncultured Gammaproteobacteria bacterium]VVH51194.1 ATP-binding region, ATPase-like [uncultured Gammaproteobacteria bacterium]